MRSRCAVLCFICLVAATTGAAAQQPARPERFNSDTTVAASPVGIAFFSSAALPGAGQWYLKADRWVAFTAMEAWAWVKYLDHRRNGRRFEREYRDLAWNVARRITTSQRKDSAFTYYEAMGQFSTSGLFDIDAQTPGIQPEIDPSTFNGEQWQRARALFLRSGQAAVPGTTEYEQALAYYRANAIPDTYIWSWAGSRLEQEEFRETIARSDAAFRNATRMLGVILANHIVSAVDALVLARVKTLGEPGLRIGSSVEPGPSSQVWTLTVQIPINGAQRGGLSRTNR